MTQTRSLDAAIAALEQWILRNGWAGWDPYDVRGTRLLAPLQKNRWTRKATDVVLDRFPLAIRKLLRVEKLINAKAMALFARGYLSRFTVTGDRRFARLAGECLDWLRSNVTPGFSGPCWGYPFDWQSRIFIPAGTPSGVVSAIACHAFLAAYEALHDDDHLRTASSCCDFLATDLNRDEVDDVSLCFSYTPLDRFHVHNANLWCASALLGEHRHTGSPRRLGLARRALAYTMSAQNRDGSWHYWAPPDDVNSYVDSYHTGFVLECAKLCRDASQGRFEWDQALARGAAFYASELFLADGTPKMTPRRAYPVDIHSCAQGVITFAELSDLEPTYLDLARKIAEWTIVHMQDDQGFFYHRVNRGLVSRIPYIRWGQAWMYRALTHLQEKASA